MGWWVFRPGALEAKRGRMLFFHPQPYATYEDAIEFATDDTRLNDSGAVETSFQPFIFEADTFDGAIHQMGSFIHSHPELFPPVWREDLQ